MVCSIYIGLYIIIYNRIFKNSNVKTHSITSTYIATNSSIRTAPYNNSYFYSIYSHFSILSQKLDTQNSPFFFSFFSKFDRETTSKTGGNFL